MKYFEIQRMVRSIGLEPTTPTMSRWCSNQLSYERIEIPSCLSDSEANSSEQGESWQEEKCNFVLLPARLLGLYPFRRFFRRKLDETLSSGRRALKSVRQAGAGENESASPSSLLLPSGQ